ncbi:MAG: flippase-like domain-containing protein [Muribaculaceae bacterium]|nr:flippase-like domain-containing protein [Muribaculaceae bacterium]
METDTANSAPRHLGLKIAAPIVIGLAVVAWLFHREFSVKVWESIHFDTHIIIAIALAWLFMIGRDFGLSWRFRAMTDRQLTWGQAIRVNLMCEFTSAVTPSAVGGSTLGMVFMNREGIELGRATTLMMTTLLLDELFFVVALPIVITTVGYSELFDFHASGGVFSMGLQTVFWIVYGAVTLWTTLLFLGIIVKPRGVASALSWVFSLRPLRRWHGKVTALADNMVATGNALRHRSLRWWAEAFMGTALSWLSRYLVVNALFWGFAPAANQLVVLGRQFVVWIVLMISPTPGGSGVSEWLFTQYYGDLLPNPSIALIIALFWRIISYYVYLIIGAFLVPTWFARKTKKKP